MSYKPAEEYDGIFDQNVSEEAIDWLFCIELNSSYEFRRWVASIVFPELKDFEHKVAYRSVSGANGETDVLWILENAGNAVMALIENKIKALSSQGDQYLRYVERGDEYIERGYCDDYKVVLLAPEQYESEDSAKYPESICYEAVAEWYRKRGDERSRYIAFLYEKAIQKLGKKVTDEEMTEFQRQVRELGRSEFPDLNVPEPKEVGKTVDWVYMKHPGYTLIYKMLKTSDDKPIKSKGEYVVCVVDLELSDRRKDKELLEERYSSAMKTEGIKIKETGKSASFRLNVPLIEPPAFDEYKVRDAFHAAEKLKMWWESTRIEGD